MTSRILSIPNGKISKRSKVNKVFAQFFQTLKLKHPSDNVTRSICLCTLTFRNSIHPTLCRFHLFFFFCCSLFAWCVVVVSFTRFYFDILIFFFRLFLTRSHEIYDCSLCTYLVFGLFRSCSFYFSFGAHMLIYRLSIAKASFLWKKK